MATDFNSTLTGELGFVRFGRSNGGFRTSFEFGTLSNFEAVLAELEMGGSFEGLGGGELAGDFHTADELRAAMVAGRCTFGEFPVTVALGSGEMARFTVEGDC